jgi:Mrp family chromosome partitioning ATPase
MSIVCASGLSLSVAFEPRPGADIGLIPPADFSNLPVVHQILKRFYEPLSELSRRARRVGPVDRGTLVLLAGLHDGVGSSTMALALAAAATADGPTALVDADVRSRGLTQLFSPRPVAGWDDVVSGASFIEDAVHYIDSREALAFFPIRAVVGDVFANGHSGLTGWLGRLRQDHQLIIVDGGSVPHGLHWASWVDAALIVRDPARSADSDWTPVWDSMEEAGAHVLGIVETFV